MEPENAESSSARKRQKVGDGEAGSSSKKAWRGDGSREHGQDPGYRDQTYGEYTRKGYANDGYGSSQKYPQQREGGDRYYSRDNSYASNSQSEANWKPRTASPWYDEYGNGANYASAGWGNASSAGGRYRGGEYAADPYYAAGEGGFGRTNTRQDSYGYPTGAAGFDHAGPPSSGSFYRADSYASRYGYDYGGAYHDRFQDRAYSAEGAVPTNRYATTRGGGKYGFANSFRAGNTANVGSMGNGKYANSFKARQYSFGAKKANRNVNAARSNTSNSSAGSSDEAQAEEKEPEKPKLITDVAVKDLLTLRTNLLDFHVTMALLKLTLKPDLELRQSLIANTIAAPPAPVVAEPPKETVPEGTSSVALARANSTANENRAKPLPGPAVLSRTASAGVSSAGAMGAMATPQLKRAASAQYGREFDHHSANNAHNARDEASRPDLVRRDSSYKEKTPNRFETSYNDGSARKPPFAGSREASSTYPAGLAAATPGYTAQQTASGNTAAPVVGREGSRERSAARSTSRPRGADKNPTTASSEAPVRDPAPGGYQRDGPGRGDSRERPQGQSQQGQGAGQAQNQGKGFARGRSRDPRGEARDGPRNQDYNYPHQGQGQGLSQSQGHGQGQGYYDSYGYPTPDQSYGGYDDRYGYGAYGYGGYDDRAGYGYAPSSSGGGGGGGYGAGYDAPGAVRRDHSREYGGSGYNRYDLPGGGGRGAGRLGGYADARAGSAGSAGAGAGAGGANSASGGRRSRSRSAGRQGPNPTRPDCSAEQQQQQHLLPVARDLRFNKFGKNRFEEPASGEKTRSGGEGAAQGEGGPRSRSPSAAPRTQGMNPAHAHAHGQGQQNAPRNVEPHPFRTSSSKKQAPQLLTPQLHVPQLQTQAQAQPALGHTEGQGQAQGSSQVASSSSSSQLQLQDPALSQGRQGSQSSQGSSQGSSNNNATARGAQFKISAYGKGNGNGNSGGAGAQQEEGFRGPNHKNNNNKFAHQQHQQQHQNPHQQVQVQFPGQANRQQNINKNFNQAQSQGYQQGHHQAHQQGGGAPGFNQGHAQGQGQGQNQGQEQGQSQGQGQGQGQGQQGNYQQNFNKFHKNQNKFQKQGGAGQGNQHHQHHQQQQGQQGHPVAAVMSPVKKLAPGETAPLRTPR